MHRLPACHLGFPAWLILEYQVIIFFVLPPMAPGEKAPCQRGIAVATGWVVCKAQGARSDALPG